MAVGDFQLPRFRIQYCMSNLDPPREFEATALVMLDPHGYGLLHR